jgi:hypothetical protein
MKILRWFGYAFVLILTAISLLVVGARFGDGPVELVAGGLSRPVN